MRLYLTGKKLTGKNPVKMQIVMSANIGFGIEKAPTNLDYISTGKSLSEALLFAEHKENILCKKLF